MITLDFNCHTASRKLVTCSLDLATQIDTFNEDRDPNLNVFYNSGNTGQKCTLLCNYKKFFSWGIPLEKNSSSWEKQIEGKLGDQCSKLRTKMKVSAFPLDQHSPPQWVLY